MKQKFLGYYRPTEDDFHKLWKDCFFVFDANVLLDLYRYSPSTSSELLNLLEAIKDRIWLPHQIALEYHDNRIDVIDEQKKAYSKILEIFDESKNSLKNKLCQFNRHPYVKTQPMLDKIEELFTSLSKKVEEQKNAHPEISDLTRDDSILKIITELFDNKVGNEYPHDKLSEIIKKAEIRYQKKIPPGYKDKLKTNDDEKYGDLLLWFQIKDKAKEIQKPIIFVTNDVKEDWFRTHDGKVIGPRPELVQEMYDFAKVPFYMYNSDRFMEFAKTYLKHQIPTKAIDEVRKTREDVLKTRSITMELMGIRTHIGMSNHHLQMINRQYETLYSQVKNLDNRIKSLDHDDSTVIAEELANLITQRNIIESEQQELISQKNKLTMDIQEYEKKYSDLTDSLKTF